MAHPPGVEPVPLFAVQRARLEEALDAVPPGGVGLLVAAAGWGKSLLIAQWLASNGSTGVRSIAVAGRHNDAMSFGADLLEAFGDLERPLDPDLRAHLVSGSAGLGADFFDRLVSGLAAQPCQVVLVFDDLHHLTNQAILDDLGWSIQCRSLESGTRSIGRQARRPPVRYGETEVWGAEPVDAGVDPMSNRAVDALS